MANSLEITTEVLRDSENQPYVRSIRLQAGWVVDQRVVPISNARTIWAT